MEHRAPRLPELSLEAVSFDHWPLCKYDLYHLPLVLRKHSEEEVEPCLQEALDTAMLVDAIVLRCRELAKRIRRHKKSTAPEDRILAAVYKKQRQGVLLDAVIVSVEIPHTTFGKFFPMTHRRLSRRIAWLIKPKSCKKKETPTVEKKSTPAPVRPAPSSPLDRIIVAPSVALPSSIAYSGIMSSPRDTLKALFAKYRVFSNRK